MNNLLVNRFFSKITIIIIILIASTKLNSQTQYERNFYGGIFFISNYIISLESKVSDNAKCDLSKVDSIYINALKFFNNDFSEALLCLTFACLPYNKIKFKFLFDSIIEIPLPSPSPFIFNKRLKNLPKNIFFDSPKDEFGDKDKLSHFFGNAFLSYNKCIFNLSKFMGIFVEMFESAFFVDGRFDRKDIISNCLGYAFGKVLKQNKTILPSQILKTYQLLFMRLY